MENHYENTGILIPFLFFLLTVILKLVNLTAAVLMGALIGYIIETIVLFLDPTNPYRGLGIILAAIIVALKSDFGIKMNFKVPMTN